MSGDTPTGLNTVSFGYSNIQFTPGQSKLGGTLITSSGDVTTHGIKSRLWNWTAPGSPSATPSDDYNTTGNWSEVINSNCYTSSTETGSNCQSGINKFSSNTKFLLNTSDSHKSVATWFSEIAPQSFADVSVDSDVQ
jgi:hypothetical protein